MSSTHPTHARGFTLVELSLVIVVIGISIVGLTGLFSNSASTLILNENIQQAAQHAQQCAEKTLSTRRDLGFAWFSTNTLSCVNAAPSVGAIYTSASGCNGHSPCPCPTGVNCRDVGITATSGSSSASITVLLVNY